MPLPTPLGDSHDAPDLGFQCVALPGQAPQTVAEYPFAVKVTGTGSPMILIPGLACSGEVWDSTVARFKDRHACHVLTLAGFAGQPPTKDEGSYTDAIVKGIAGYIRDKKLDKPAIVGHSLGGFICFKLAAAEPDLVGPIVAVDGFPAAGLIFMPDATDADRKAFTEMFLKKYSDAGKDEFAKLMRDFFGQMLSGEKLDVAAKWAAASDQKSVVKALGEVFTGDARGGLEKVKSPVLLLGAYHDGQKQFFSRRKFSRSGWRARSRR